MSGSSWTGFPASPRSSPTTEPPDTLVALARTGDRRAIARLISVVETGGPDADAALAALHPHTGNAYLVGITGAPGAGKSTLTDRLVSRIRKDGDEVGVLAVDPTSPFSGGAILGDRVRMQQHSSDDGVFIRSMATRGHLGGLATAASPALQVLDAAGKPWILVETVGVGQVEVEIAGSADTTVVVLNPGWGDGVQAAKAGLLEIADVFAVNKADRAGSADAVRDIAGMLDLAGHTPWRPPIIETVAIEGTGTDELWDSVLEHRAYLESSGTLVERREARVRAELRARVLDVLAGDADRLCSGDGFDAAVTSVLDGSTDPSSAAALLIADH